MPNVKKDSDDALDSGKQNLETAHSEVSRITDRFDFSPFGKKTASILKKLLKGFKLDARTFIGLFIIIVVIMLLMMLMSSSSTLLDMSSDPDEINKIRASLKDVLEAPYTRGEANAMKSAAEYANKNFTGDIDADISTFDDKTTLTAEDDFSGDGDTDDADGDGKIAFQGCKFDMAAVEKQVSVQLRNNGNHAGVRNDHKDSVKITSEDGSGHTLCDITVNFSSSYDETADVVLAAMQAVNGAISSYPKKVYEEGHFPDAENAAAMASADPADLEDAAKRIRSVTTPEEMQALLNDTSSEFVSFTSKKFKDDLNTFAERDDVFFTYPVKTWNLDSISTTYGTKTVPDTGSCVLAEHAGDPNAAHVPCDPENGTTVQAVRSVEYPIVHAVFTTGIQYDLSSYHQSYLNNVAEALAEENSKKMKEYTIDDAAESLSIQIRQYYDSYISTIDALNGNTDLADADKHVMAAVFSGGSPDADYSKSLGFLGSVHRPSVYNIAPYECESGTCTASSLFIDGHYEYPTTDANTVWAHIGKLFPSLVGTDYLKQCVSFSRGWVYDNYGFDFGSVPGGGGADVVDHLTSQAWGNYTFEYSITPAPGAVFSVARGAMHLGELGKYYGHTGVVEEYNAEEGWMTISEGNGGSGTVNLHKRVPLDYFETTYGSGKTSFAWPHKG